MLQNLVLESRTANTLCASLVGLCENPAVRPYNLTFPSPKPSTSRPPPSGQDPIRVVHFSDSHVDLSYESGCNYDCSKPICCRVYNEDDAAGNASSPCGPWGNPKCDPPYQLQLSMMSAMADLNPAFSIYTGDVVAHDVWLVDKTEVLADFNATYGAMENNLGLVYATLGNHDTAPVNLFPPNTVPNKYNPQWAYDALAADWATLTGLPSVQNANKYGSYSAIHSNSSLRIISYNSILYYKSNFFAYEEPMQHDPNNQLTWLITELDAAEQANQRVWLISHIPTGNAGHFHDYSHYLDQIIQRYEATIAALFFGHTHADEFQISYSDYSNRTWDTATAIGYVAPAMTPTSGPPSFRVYEIDPVTFGVLDYTQYIANISNLTSVQKPAWIPYYSAKETYAFKLSPNTTDLNPSSELTSAFWHNVTVAMDRDLTLFQSFWTRRTRGFEVSICEGDCVKKKLCALRAGDAQYNCVVPTPGFSFGKRGGSVQLGGSGLRQTECSHAGMVSLLGKILDRARVLSENTD